MTGAAGLLVSSSVSAWLELLVGVVVGAASVGAYVFGPALTWWARRRRAARVRVRRVGERREANGEVDGGEPATSDATLSEAIREIARQPIRGPRLYISELSLREFRCFESIDLSLHYPGRASELRYPNVNLVLGDNGSGKSTLLKAVAIAALGPVLQSSGFTPYRLIRKTAMTASITGHFLLDEPAGEPHERHGQVQLSRIGDYERIDAHHDLDAWRGIFDELDPSFLVVGYGVNRRTAAEDVDRGWIEQSRRLRRYQRVASLFDERALLTPLSAWLPIVDRKRREEVEEILLALLPSDTRLTDGTAPEPIFRHRGVEVPYRALSDGYKSFIGWVGDLLFQIDSVARGSLPLREVGGIVLVDEVDLLLHPAWQRNVVPNIAAALPELQFVFTTHSPIVAGTLESGNILVARENDDGASDLVRLGKSIHGLNAEQILLSSYFELESTRAPGVQAELRDLARRAMHGDDDAAHEYLRTLAGKYGERPADDEFRRGEVSR